MTMVLPSELVFPTAIVERTLGTGEARRHRRVRVVISGDHVRMYENDGTLTQDARFIESSYESGAKNFDLTTDNGETWHVRKQGCNCGGG